MSIKLRKRKLSSGKVSLYLDIYHDGERHYEFLKLYLGSDREANKETMRLAESIRAKRQLELNSQGYGFTAAFKQKANFIDYFEKLAGTKGDSETAWPNTLVKLREHSGDHLTFKQANEQWLEDFKAFLLDGLAPITARTYFAKVRATLRKAHKQKIIPYNPAEHVEQIKRVETERTFLTIEELRKMAEASCWRTEKHPDVRRAFLFACYTGLRISDVRALTWDRLSNGRLHYRQQKTNGQEYLPLSRQALDLLGDRGEPDEAVFTLPSLGTIEITLRDWAEAAGVKKHLTFHVSRHTFATLALSNDVDIYTVSKLLGHKDVHTTQVYAKVIDKKKQEAVDRLPEI